MSYHSLFSKQAKSYATYRPEYPSSLFEFLATEAPTRSLAWDCATGSGQSARGLAPHFQRVIATDLNAEQITQASAPSHVEFRVASAERSGIDSNTVDLITVAQAAHWFDHGAFHQECRRVLKPGGIIAVFGYGFFSISPEVDRILDPFGGEFLAPYWSERNLLVQQGYRDLPFPFSRVKTPRDWKIEVEWELEQVLGYLNSWSATQRYKDAHDGENPVRTIEGALTSAWGDPSMRRRVTYDLAVLVGKNSPLGSSEN